MDSVWDFIHERVSASSALLSVGGWTDQSGEGWSGGRADQSTEPIAEWERGKTSFGMSLPVDASADDVELCTGCWPV